MKRKSCLLVLAALLLASAAAHATATPQAAAPQAPEAAPAVAAPFVPEAPSLCQAPASSLTAPLLNPAPRRRTTPAVCGSCGPAICRGVTEGSTCRIVGLTIYTCINALGNSCSNDGLDECLCWTGPLP
jgi:hypothetical protein